MLLLVVLLVLLSLKEKREKEAILNREPIPVTEQELMYHEQQNELRFTKNLQWNIVYYLALVFGAVFAISNTVEISSSIKIILFGMVFLALDYGIYFLFQIQYNLRNIRIDITRTSYFSQRYISVEMLKQQKEEEKRVFRDWRFFVPILVIVLLGFAIDAFSLWENLWNNFNNLAGRLIQ